MYLKFNVGICLDLSCIVYVRMRGLCNVWGHFGNTPLKNVCTGARNVL